MGGAELGGALLGGVGWPLGEIIMTKEQHCPGLFGATTVIASLRFKLYTISYPLLEARLSLRVSQDTAPGPELGEPESPPSSRLRVKPSPTRFWSRSSEINSSV